MKELLKVVEERFNHGGSTAWTQYDFEKLSENILSSSNVLLSTTTLKRLWGKTIYTSNPSIKTLNALSVYVGFADFRAFEQSIVQGTQSKTENKEESKILKEINPPAYRKLSIFISFILFGVAAIFLFKKITKTNIDTNDFQFSLNKIKTTGLPNSVVFTYHASKAKTDSVFIVQTWDIRRKTLVPKNGNNHSAIYYYPGFFNTKLIIDSTVVKNQDLQISTDGWLGLVEMPEKPIYFSKEEIKAMVGIKVDDNLLAKHSLPTQPSSPKVRFFNQHDMDNLMNDNFTFETEFRNHNPAADNACHFTEILIQCKNDIIIVPLADSACVGDLSIAFAGFYKQAKFSDLSGFGANLNNWTKLKIECKNRHAVFYVNGKKAYDLDCPHNPKGIVGVQYRFVGAGEIKYSRFWDGKGREVKL
jgi:hypothetical protein